MLHRLIMARSSVANAAFSFARRKFSAESSTTTTAASKPATPAPSNWAAQSSTSNAARKKPPGVLFVVDTGTAVSLGLAGVAAMGASMYAGIQAHKNEKNNAEMKADLDKAIAEKEKVLKAQADSVKAQADSLKAQADSLKTQAWAAYLLPSVASFAALAIAYTGKTA